MREGWKGTRVVQHEDGKIGIVEGKGEICWHAKNYTSEPSKVEPLKDDHVVMTKFKKKFEEAEAIKAIRLGYVIGSPDAREKITVKQYLLFFKFMFKKALKRIFNKIMGDV